MKLKIVVSLCVLSVVAALDSEDRSTHNRDSKKLFGGYRITPKFCKPTRTPSQNLGGPNICMFNHECTQRRGQVVGACMDGFLFGACCQVSSGEAGELMDSEAATVPSLSNDLYHKRPSSSATQRPQQSTVDITLNGVSQIAQSLLHENTLVGIDNNDFKSSTPSSVSEKKTTVRNDDTTPYAPELPALVHISISNSPGYFTPTPGFQRPIFRPRPPADSDKYVLVPTISHPTSPNNTEGVDAIVNINQITSTTKKPPSTSYVYSSAPTRRPGHTTQKATTSRKPPSTSYVYSSTPLASRPSTTKKPTTEPYIYSSSSSSSFRPAHSTHASSPDAFVTSSRPPSTSYVYSSYSPTRKPLPSTITSFVSGPTFTVSSSPGQLPGIPSPAPTVIVLGPVEDTVPQDQTTRRPIEYSTSPSPPAPIRKPVTQLTINNHITQNIYSTERPYRPTVLITPKPSVSTSYPIKRPSTEFVTAAVELQTTNDDMNNNFPPVRNPNLNMSSAAAVVEDDVTTPVFIEDQVLDQKVESFVNKIIEGLQEPFQDLKDVVYNGNKTSSSTPKPIKKQGTTTKKPVTKPASSKPTTRRPTTRPSYSTPTRRPTTTTKRTRTTKRPITTTTTTTESFIEEDDGTTITVDSGDYRKMCGIRPLLKTGRIVGGKGAKFGEFPWQVLVRESTWFGMFTKNKCGGVLISNRYVMTAAHCQPGFLASLVAVFGELDISGDLESKRPINRNVKRVIVHRQYDAATFENDLALLELEHPIQFDSHIVPICLPRDGEDFTGRIATVTGWGRLKYGGGVPSVLQEVQVPIMENQVCQEMFRTAGHSKVILDSFLCAGYATGQKDSCEGDSGGPLVLQRPDGRYQLAGTVSHGIKCAAPYLPGVYMRTTYYKPWITSITGLQ